jgi:UDP-N-acetylmuramate--alanine ligase
MTETARKVHFVGVGGIGMSGLAEILLNLGYSVSGTDLAASDITRRLETYGLAFHEGHAAKHVGDASIVVASAAVPENNPELEEARRRRIPIMHRSDLLADLLRLKPNAVVVGGSHGKTTTTSMITSILDCANIGATSLVGGILQRSGTNARWGTGDYIVAEADEHDGSFLRLHPTIAVVTNVDAEHLDYYGTVDNIKRAFTDFCNGVPFFGYAVLCYDDMATRDILDDIETVCVTYGLDPAASLVGNDVRIENPCPEASIARQLEGLHTRVTVVSRDPLLGEEGTLGDLVVPALGEDNIRNALAACTVGLCLGMRFGLIADGLREFKGVHRRMQVRGEVRGMTVVEDYAHHPTEIRSTIRAIRKLNPGRLRCMFQPHLFSRTKYFYREFAETLAEADEVWVTDIYPSREEPIAGVDAGMIVDAAAEAGAAHVRLMRDKDEVAEHVAATAQPGDVVLVLGAGNISGVIPDMLRAVESVS